MAITISGSGITSANIADGTIANADINDVASSKLTGALPAIDGSSLTGITTGKVLQVVNKTSISRTTITSSGSWQDATDFNLSITPSSTSSKVLVTFCIPARISGSGSPMRGGFKILRGTTAVWNSDGFVEHIHVRNADNEHDQLMTISYLDSPNTTSSTNYKAQGYLTNGSQLILFESDKGSNITLMEIAG